MRNVVFVAPFFMEATLRFVDAVASLPGARVGLVSADPLEKLPPAVRSRLAAHFRVGQALDTSQLADAVRGIARAIGPVDRVVAALEELQVPLGELREQLGIPGMDAATARNFRDKSRMKDVLRGAGLPCARHRLAATAEEAWSFAAEAGYPLVAKPPAGAGARSTFRLEGPQALGELLGFGRVSPEAPLQLEEFVTGEEHSYDSVCLGGEVRWSSVSRYDPAPLEVLRVPWIQWCVLLPREIDTPELAGIHREGPAALRALGMVNGLTHMEWFRRPGGGLAISEVAARPPGAQFMSLLSWAHDTDMYRAWAELAVFDRFDPPQRRYACGAAYLRGQGAGRVRAVHGLERAQREVAGLVVEARLPREGQEPSGSYEGDGYVIVRHPDTARVEDALRHIITQVRVELG